ncbi:MAG: adenylosuccinate synthetase, partial [Acidimicrobiia bacterium]|nr:adenylosuccinate synthetase [Acidimicrobiia bacterium]
GITKLFITKLDILSVFAEIGVAVAYELDGTRFDEFPRQQTVLYHCTPVLEFQPGWMSDISDLRRYDDLPKEARSYLEFIEDQTGVPVGWISVGPERNQLIEK